jgi:signal transduction histidine kinase
MRDLGGDIEVESTLGEGTTVSLFLPACQEAESRVAT